MLCSFLIQVFEWTYVFISPGSRRSGIAASHDNFTFNTLRNSQIVFQSVCMILQSHQQCSNFYTSLPTLVIVFFIITILEGVKRDLIVLICTSLMTNDVEHLFMCLLAIHIPSLKKCLLKFYFVYFKIGLSFYNNIKEYVRILHIFWI